MCFPDSDMFISPGNLKLSFVPLYSLWDSPTSSDISKLESKLDMAKPKLAGLFCHVLMKKEL